MHALFRILTGLIVFSALCAPSHAGYDETAPDIGYFALKPSIVSNLTGGPKYIRCDIQLMTEQAEQLPRIELHAPALRHAVLMLLAAQDGTQLTTRDGKERLRKDALAAVQEQLKGLTGETLVNDLYFTAYYVR